MLQPAYQLQAPNDASDGDGRAGRFQGAPVENDELPYRVEVWDDTAAYVERVVAVSANPAIGYAAYYAAAREFPGRDVTLRHKDRILSRWAGRSH